MDSHAPTHQSPGRSCPMPSRRHPAPRSCPSGPTSWKATPRPPPRSKPSWPTPWRPPAATPRPRPEPWCPGSATCCSRTTRSKPTAATSWTSCGTCRPRESTPLQVTADHVKLYKRALLEAGLKSATVARRLSVLRGTYQQLAAKGLVAWETAQDIAAVKAPGVQKNSTPSLTQRQAIALLEAIPTDTLQGIRDLALMSVFFLTGCRVSAVVGASRGAPGDRRRRALSPRHREAEQEAAEDPARRRAAGARLSRSERASETTRRGRCSGR